MADELIALKIELKRLQIEQLKSVSKPPNTHQLMLQRIDPLIELPNLPPQIKGFLTEIRKGVKDCHMEKIAVVMRKGCEYILISLLPSRKKSKSCLGDLLHQYNNYSSKDFMVVNSLQIIRMTCNAAIHIQEDPIQTKPLKLDWGLDNFFHLVDYLYA